LKKMTLNIGQLTLENPFILAPLAGYTDLPFRLLCREYGAGLCYSEMLSCHGLAYRQQNTLNMLKTVAEERPVAFQLFGSEPDIMAEAATILDDLPIDIIDINMGCPVKKVVKKGAGAALMKTEELAGRIIRNVCSKTSKPVTVKFRSGWTHDSLNAVDFARMAEEAGAAAVIVHGRTWSQAFSGTADWNVISRVKQSVSIPVIGNGDITCYQDGIDMMQETGCDGVMVGRGALGNPWVFTQMDTTPTVSQRITALRRHLELIDKYLPAERMVARVKNHAGRYFKGAPGSARIRKAIYDTKSFRELRELVESLCE
jgi:nifR3 family TIM-barrel protein